jgi:hypothetical protein
MSSRNVVAVEVVVRKGCARDKEVNPPFDALRNDYVIWWRGPRAVCNVQ